MTTERRPEVTQAMVRHLWDKATQPPLDLVSIRHRAEALLDLVNSANPVVNWGLTDLHALTGSPEATVEQLHQRRAAWLTELRRYEVDPDLWLHTYFQDMVRNFTKTHGLDRGRAFATKLVRRTSVGK
jgi:hypothetical protein